MVLVQKWRFLQVFCFRKISHNNMFDNILETKKCFQDNKNEKFKSRKMGIFSRGLINGFGQLCEV